MENTDSITLSRIEQAHPAVRQKMLTDYQAICRLMPKHKSGRYAARPRFASVWRSPEEQIRLFNQRPKVTNATAWQSFHNYGLAFDLVVLYDRDGDGKFEQASWNLRDDIDKDGRPEWRICIDYLEGSGWEWAGRWTSFPEAPHFQITRGLTWRQLKERIDRGRFTTETVGGQQIKYVQI